MMWWGAQGFLEASWSTSLCMGPAANGGEQTGRGASWGQSEGLSVGCGVSADSSPHSQPCKWPLCFSPLNGDLLPTCFWRDLPEKGLCFLEHSLWVSPCVWGLFSQCRFLQSSPKPSCAKQY